MINFHGAKKTHSYFEGWYFKHQGKAHTVSFIPGVNFDAKGKKSAFVQVITDAASFYLEYPYLCFHASDHKMSLQIESNKFSDTGVEINIQTSDIHCTGTIKYESLLPLKSDIMGPFRFFPFMECHHGIISMGHGLTGSLLLNDERIDFDGGIGYIEKDWGKSFPKTYLWTQCNWHDKGDCCIMLSIAHIPFLWTSFTGCICIIYYNGVEYRLATYLGVRIDKNTEREAIIQQGDLRLEIKLIEQIGHRLIAPIEGGMNRIIFESPACKVNYKFSCKNKVVFDFTSNKAGYESSIGIKKISK